MEGRVSSQLLAEQPPHLSYSSLTTLATCGEKFRLSRGLKIRGTPSWAQVGGSAVHAASEAYDHAPGGWTPESSVAYFEQHFEEATKDQERFSDCDRADFKATGRASKQYPNKEDRSWWHENGPIFVQNWVQWRQMSPWEILIHNDVPAIELEVNIMLGGKLNKGFIDRIFVTPQGEVIILDLKSGASTPTGSFQLGQYKVAVQQALGIEATFGTYWMARSNTTTSPEDLARWDQDYLDETYWRMARIVEEGLFIPHVDRHCGWCDVADYCRANGGSKWQEAQGESLVSMEERN